jgi:hypothetical protein
MFGSSEQRNACYLFEGRDTVIKKMSESSMGDFHKNISHYEDYLFTLDEMLEGCEPWLSEEELAEELVYDPDYENMTYDMDEYVFDGRTYVYKSEIVAFRDILNEKFVEYDKYLNEITVNAGVSLALIMSREIRYE